MPAHKIHLHYRAKSLSDRVALGLTLFLRSIADAFFVRRYGHRAVVLETIAAVPGMVGATLTHLKSLRAMTTDHGWIRALMNEAENERMHLMTFVQIAKPSLLERWIVLMAQWIFYCAFFMLYLCSSRTAHRLVGYFEEGAVKSYTAYLEELESGRAENVPAPPIAVKYWDLGADARLSDVVRAVRDDAMHHRDTNHHFADELAGRAAFGKAKTEPLHG
jgi:ubiquinol oxidase